MLHNKRVNNIKAAYTVTQINTYIKKLLDNDLILSNILIKGEISNFKNHSSGHMYFSLKDEESVIKCIMFKNLAENLKFVPENGMNVIISGYVTAYVRDGQYQIYCDSMTVDGIGDLYIAFEKLKEKLKKDGIFDESHKMKLPLLPKSVAVITSPTGAVIKDIINVSLRRFPKANIKLFPSSVQGADAYKEIVSAINTINEKKLADVIIIARGGGSMEDLWNFNREEVAYAIYNSNIPVVSAVGHETDFTIADFVADLRAPTPSAAAEIVFPKIEELEYRLAVINKRLKLGLINSVEERKKRLKDIKESYYFRRPLEIINKLKIRLDNTNKDLSRDIEKIIGEKRKKFENVITKVDTLSPLKTLARGYTVAIKKDRIVTSKDEILKGEKFTLKFYNGEMEAERL